MKKKGKVRLNLNEMRRLAGLPLLKEQDEMEVSMDLGGESPSHSEEEREVFQACVDACQAVLDMVEQQLEVVDESDPRHAEYVELVESTQHHIDLLRSHLEGYEGGEDVDMDMDAEADVVEVPDEEMPDDETLPTGPALGRA